MDSIENFSANLGNNFLKARNTKYPSIVPKVLSIKSSISVDLIKNNWVNSISNEVPNPMATVFF